MPSKFTEAKAAAETCKTRTEFASKHPALYEMSRKQDWLDQFLPRYVRSGNEFERMQEAAAGVWTLPEFKAAHPDLTRIARRHGWLDEFFPQRPKFVRRDGAVLNRICVASLVGTDIYSVGMCSDVSAHLASLTKATGGMVAPVKTVYIRPMNIRIVKHACNLVGEHVAARDKRFAVPGAVRFLDDDLQRLCALLDVFSDDKYS